MPAKKKAPRPNRSRIRDAAAAAALTPTGDSAPAPEPTVAERFWQGSANRAGKIASEKEREVEALLSLVAIAQHHGYLKNIATTGD